MKSKTIKIVKFISCNFIIGLEFIVYYILILPTNFIYEGLIKIENKIYKWNLPKPYDGSTSIMNIIKDVKYSTDISNNEASNFNLRYKYLTNKLNTNNLNESEAKELIIMNEIDYNTIMLPSEEYLNKLQEKFKKDNIQIVIDENVIQQMDNMKMRINYTEDTFLDNINKIKKAIKQ